MLDIVVVTATLADCREPTLARPKGGNTPLLLRSGKTAAYRAPPGACKKPAHGATGPRGGYPKLKAQTSSPTTRRLHRPGASAHWRLHRYFNCSGRKRRLSFFHTGRTMFPHRTTGSTLRSSSESSSADSNSNMFGFKALHFLIPSYRCSGLFRDN